MKKIDADALMDRFREEMRDGHPEILDNGWKDVFTAMTDAMIGIIDEMPAVDDGRKVGRWERMTDNGVTFYRCGYCETGYQLTRYDYCPYCGADMNGGYDG